MPTKTTDGAAITLEIPAAIDVTCTVARNQEEAHAGVTHKRTWTFSFDGTTEDALRQALLRNLVIKAQGRFRSKAMGSKTRNAVPVDACYPDGSTFKVADLLKGASRVKVTKAAKADAALEALDPATRAAIIAKWHAEQAAPSDE